MIACCDGWVSKDLDERIINGIRHGQVMPDDRSQPVVLPMERTGEARILVVNPAGQPLQGAAVNMCPNQSLGRATSIIEAGIKVKLSWKQRTPETPTSFARNSRCPAFTPIRMLPASR